MNIEYFTAEWCPPCKVIKKTNLLDKFTEKNPNISITTFDVDSPEGSKRAAEFDIKSIPTFVLFKDDGTTKKATSLLTLPALEKFVNE